MQRRERDDERQHHGLGQAAEEAPAPRNRFEILALRRGSALRALLQDCRNATQRAACIDVAQGDARKQRDLADFGNKPCRQHGVTAEFGEEVSFEIDRTQAKGLGCRLEQLRFCPGARRFLGLCRLIRHQRDCGKRLAIDLARGETRQRHMAMPSGRHHIGRQLGRQHGTGLVPIEAVARCDDMGDEHLFAIRRPMHHHGGGLHIRKLADDSLNLAEFDAVAADLDLVVDTTEEMQLALFVH